jgi:hypothetical protein
MNGKRVRIRKEPVMAYMKYPPSLAMIPESLSLGINQDDTGTGYLTKTSKNHIL